ncbi:alpha-amylase family glycosyl hydrolase [Ilumatobacter sp.]|uniref:alpha-amylase family glycosyl hydrolase n=1 Tax=Ilumatobacter sp. TaxID=1967498 RepID=UPI003B52C0B5
MTATATQDGDRTEMQHWWQDAVVYQVYVRSFADADGDGIGDLEGIRRELEHIASLGVDAIWLNPCYPSPQRDHGYDVADYFAIHHEYGDLEVFDRLVADARTRGLRVLMDLVPNHCSDQHAWFRAATAAAPGSAERARFYFRDGRPSADGSDPHGSPPNNWMAAFGGTAWTRASDDDPQWYLGTFTPQQPDFDHTNADVARMFAEVFEFWFDRGVEGFRVDAITPVGKDPDLPDAPPVPPGTDELQVAWENPHTVFRPEGHDVWRAFRTTIDSYMAAHPGRDLMMVAESYMNARPDLVRAFVNPEQFHQAFAFDLLLSPWDRAQIERAITDSIDIVETGATPTWALNNHDVQRIVTRLGRATATDPASVTNNALGAQTSPVDLDVGRRRARAAIALAMAMPGSIYLYMGEELGLPEVLDVPDERREDPVFLHTDGAKIGRDGCRIPLPWTDDPATSHGFSSPGDAGTVAEPWLPQPEGWGERAVQRLDTDETSMPALYRELIALRRDRAVAQRDPVELLDLAPGLVALRRGALVVLTNVTSSPIAVDALGDVDGATPLFSSEPSEMHTPGVVPPDCTVWLVDDVE